MHKKPIFRDLIIIAILLVIVAIFMLLNRSKSSFQLTACVDAEHMISSEKIIISEKTPIYEIDADIPLPVVPEIQAFIREQVAERIAEFKNSIINPTEGDIVSTDGGPATFTLKGELVSVQSFVNYKLSTYTFTGGAHGMPFTETFTFSRSNPKQPLTINDVIISPEAFSNIVSTVIIPKILAQQADVYSNSEYYTEKTLTDFLTTGADWLSNFNNIILTNEGIIFTFSAYSIAPYSSGEPEIMLTWAEMGDALSDKIQELRNVCMVK